MVKGKTSSGFEFLIPDSLKTDIRFLRAYRKMSNGRDEMEQVDAALDLVSVVFSNEAEETRFYEHIGAQEGNEGRAPVEDVYREIGEIIALAAAGDEEIKNS